MKWLKTIWHELVRPRGHRRHRFYRVGRSSRSGVAVLLAIAFLSFFSVMAITLVHGTLTRVRTAVNFRQEAQAENLAVSGFQIYRLILIAAKGMDQGMSQLPMLSQLGVSGDSLWQQVPFINTQIMRMVFVSSGRVDADDIAEMEEEGMTEEELEESRESSGSSRNFLDFKGDFFAEVSDESGRINIKAISGANVAELQQNPAGAQLLSLMTGVNRCDAIRSMEPASADTTQDNTRFFNERNLEPLELIGNLADWTDVDTNRAYLGGNEDSLYDDLDEPYKAKNAPFDTLQEVRLVEGWHRDDVWERFGEYVTVYGDGKVNVNTAECEVLWALLKTYVEPIPSDDLADRYIRSIDEYKGLMDFSSPDQFVSLLVQEGATVKPEMKTAISTKTWLYRIQSTGEVGNARVTIDAVVDFANSTEGQVLYWRMQ